MEAGRSINNKVRRKSVFHDEKCEALLGMQAIAPLALAMSIRH